MSGDGLPAGAPVSVRRGFAWLAAGYAGYMLCQWATLVVLARWGSPESVGQFGLALATTAPIILFTGLGLRRVFATDVQADCRFADYLGLRLVSNVAAMGLSAMVVWMAGYRAETAFVVLAMGVAKSIEATSDIVYGLFQRQGRVDFVARSLLLRGPLSVAGLGAGFLATGSVFWGVLGMGAGWLAVFGAYDWPRAARLQGSAVCVNGDAATFARRAAALAALALPLGIVALLSSLKASIPALVIAKLLGEGALGLFMALAYFHAASNRIVTALGEAATVRLAATFAKGDERGFARLVGSMLLAALGIGAAGLGIAAVAGGPLMGLFYGSEYAAQGAVLVLIMAAACAANLQTVLDYAMTSARQFRIQPWLYGASAGLLLILCVVLVPAHGLRGAAIALGLGSGLEGLATGAIVGCAFLRRRAAGTAPVLEGS
jgi:O-antigen/teichoic acid export membrane protein